MENQKEENIKGRKNKGNKIQGIAKQMDIQLKERRREGGQNNDAHERKCKGIEHIREVITNRWMSKGKEMQREGKSKGRQCKLMEITTIRKEGNATGRNSIGNER